MKISKSKFVSGVQCLKRLYLQVHEPELAAGPDDADEAMLHAAVAPEFDRKAAEEASWPNTTDCDRLDQAFEELNARGVIALHNAGARGGTGGSPAPDGDSVLETKWASILGASFIRIGS